MLLQLYGTLELSDLNSTCWLKIDAGNDSIENIQWRILKHVPTAERENPKYSKLEKVLNEVTEGWEKMYWVLQSLKNTFISNLEIGWCQIKYYDK